MILSLAYEYDSKKRWIYKMLLFLSIFCLIYPEQYTFIPVSTLWFVHLWGMFIYTFYYVHFAVNKIILKLFLYGMVISMVGLFSAKIINDGDLDVAKRGFLLIVHIFDSLWIAYLLSKISKGNVLYELLKWLVYAAIVQGIVSFVFFVFPTIYTSYKSLVVMNDLIDDKTSFFSSFRLMGVGGLRYATAAVQYGLMLWAVILLRKERYGIIGNSSFLFYFVSSLFCIAGIMSGRVFFVFLLFTIVYIYYLYDKNLLVAVSHFFKLFIPIFVLVSLVFIYFFASNEELINWAFELFINLGESGELESSSTNQLKDMYIFPDNISTWLLGDGKSIDGNGFYMNTDVGYIRSIFYWGIMGSIVYYSIQYYMYRMVARVTYDYNIICYTLFVFLWFLIYSLKDFYSIEKILVLLIIVLVYSREDDEYELLDSNTSV